METRAPMVSEEAKRSVQSMDRPVSNSLPTSRKRSPRLRLRHRWDRARTNPVAIRMTMSSSTAMVTEPTTICKVNTGRKVLRIDQLLNDIMNKQVITLLLSDIWVKSGRREETVLLISPAKLYKNCFQVLHRFCCVKNMKAEPI